MASLSASESAAWRGFLDTHALLQRLMQQTLEPHGISTTEYGVLVLADEQGKAGIRMGALAERLGTSCGGMTRMVERLQRDGYVRRTPCAQDGRAMVVSTTPEGQGLLRRARRVHLRDVRQLFLDRLTPAEQRQLARLWERLLAAP